MTPAEERKRVLAEFLPEISKILDSWLGKGHSERMLSMPCSKRTSSDYYNVHGETYRSRQMFLVGDGKLNVFEPGTLGYWEALESGVIGINLDLQINVVSNDVQEKP